MQGLASLPPTPVPPLGQLRPRTPLLPIVLADESELLELIVLPSVVLTESDSHWFWRILLLLTSWLHLHYHLPHAACNLMLRVMRIIFVSLGALTLEDRPPLTLNTTLKRLGLVDNFRILPTCPNLTCWIMYPADSPWSLKCGVCDTNIFLPVGSDNTNGSIAYRPALVTPTRLISEQLEGLINQPGIKKALDDWRTQRMDLGKL